MDTITCIRTRRSIRKFTGKPVERKLLEQIVEAASYAPSWKNTQITRYIAVDDPVLKEKIASECCDDHNAAIIRSAPLLVATAMVEKRSGYERDGSFSTEKKDGWQMYDCGCAGQTFCLAAHELGVGTVIMGIFNIEKSSQLLEVPEGQLICSLIAAGYPDGEASVPKKKTVSDLLTWK